jgi:hypothetical protein
MCRGWLAWGGPQFVSEEPMETLKATSLNTKVWSSAGWPLQRKALEVGSLLACCLVNACRDALAPTARVLPVPPVVRSVQPLPQSVAILPYTPSANVPLATYDFVEGVLVEGVIDGFVHVTSNANASAVHANADVDYKGVYDYSGGGQCDWAATISSPQLSAPGFLGCQSAEPRYTQIPRWLDTIVLGGYGGNGTITARRGGGSGDPLYCSDGQLCHVVSGMQTVTLTPLPATIRLTAPGRTEIAPKTILIPDPYTLPVSFTVSSTPSAYRGITVPRRALSWQWIPASGDSAISTLVCPLPPASSNSYTCAGYIYERGSVVVTARVNGVVQVDTMTVTGPQVKIMPDSTNMRPSVQQYQGKVKQAAVNSVTQKVHVSVIDTLGRPIPNKTVALTLFAPNGEAGHAHATNVKPAGTIILAINTGPTGDTTVTYTSPEASGAVWIKGTSSGSGWMQKRVLIRVPDLYPYGPEVGADTTGGTSSHPSPNNHYATAAHIARLSILAYKYSQKFPGSKLTFNDSSLPLGGLFDLAGDWHPDHLGHRWGNNTDVKTHNGTTEILSSYRRKWIWIFWMHILGQGGQGYLMHPLPKPHIHLSY